MDINRLNQGEKIAGIAGVALFIFMFFAWYSVDVAGFSASANAWESFDLTDLILFVTAVAAVGAAIVAANGASASLPIAASSVVAGLGGFSTLLVLYRLLNPPGEGDVSRSIGIFLGLIAVAAIAYGGYLGMQEDQTSFSDEADRLR
jgi:hypothetical protein